MTKYCVAAHVNPEACADCVKPRGRSLLLGLCAKQVKKTIGEGVKMKMELEPFVENSARMESEEVWLE